MRSTFLILIGATLFLVDDVWASYAIYVGKNLTADGSVMIGGSGDEVSSHWLEVVPAKDHPPGATIAGSPIRFRSGIHPPKPPSSLTRPAMPQAAKRPS